MKDGKITGLEYRNGIAELKIRIDKKDFKYRAAMDLIQYSILDKSKKCRFEANREWLTKLVVDGKDIVIQDVNQKGKRDKNSKNAANSRPSSVNTSSRPSNHLQADRSASLQRVERAKAPYNFVPINQAVIQAPKLKESVMTSEDSVGKKHHEIPSFDQYHAGFYTGFIDLDITTLTPLYIRDTYQETEECKAGQAKETGGKWENPDFFSPGGIPRIPGSTLRGMTRNLVEIVTCSRMEYIEDSTLYYRSLADECRSVRLEYQNNMGQRDYRTKRTIYKFNAGYLKCTGDEYQILPAKKERGTQYKRIPKKNRPYFSWHWQDDGSCITVSGLDPNRRKTMDWLVNPVDQTAAPIKISRVDLNSYRDDINRFRDKRNISEAEKQDGDLLRCLRVEEGKENSRNMVPCFYVLWKDEDGKERVSFGHTAYFRLAYRLSIKKHLPQSHQTKENIIDLTSAIFGKVSDFAGRVFCEDAIIDSEDLDKLSQKEVYLKILSNPKPTTFQNYLEQKGTDKNTLVHWNSQEALLRGYKMYWHRETPQKGNNGWEATPEEVTKSPSQYTLARVVDKGCHFKGRIRFENLSAIELGALLFVLELPEGCAHKIGMGKPLGLGSVKIKPVLTLSSRIDKSEPRTARYGRLFKGNRWYLAEKAGETEEFKDQFTEYIMKQGSQEIIGNDPVKSYWKTERMKELRVMLDFDTNTAANNWLDNTRYLEIQRKVSVPGTNKKTKNEFKNRSVLPLPSEVLYLAGIKYE